MIITILGAGAMGSAIATPLLDAGHEVRLWGTHLDDHLIDAVEAGQPHPRTGVTVPSGVVTYRYARIAEALDGATIAVLAVSSGGVIDITRLAAAHLDEVRAIWITSKGFAPDKTDRIELLPQVMEQVLTDAGGCCPSSPSVARARRTRWPPAGPPRPSSEPPMPRRSGPPWPPLMPTASPSPPTATVLSCAPR